ncbi:MAG: ComF family protein [Thermodesulfobacteriota bacterium]|nr:MAG: ComF family protein [Thermodesulfobacteriota bacterium]
MTIETGTPAAENFLVSFFDIFFPPLCTLCEKDLKKEGAAFCRACEARFSSPAVKGPHCMVCGALFDSDAGGEHCCGECLKKAPPFELARSVYVYEGVVLEAVHAFKYSGRTVLAPALGTAMALKAEKEFPAPDVAVPVPLYPARLRRRGFNQSLLLARRVAKALSIKVDYLNLERKVSTKSQVGLGHSERLSNVSGAFSVKDPAAFKEKKVLLIDDVYTTGATVRECSKVLKRAGAQICVLTLARAR